MATGSGKSNKVNTNASTWEDYTPPVTQSADSGADSGWEDLDGPDASTPPTMPTAWERAKATVAGPGTFLGTSEPEDTWSNLFHHPLQFIEAVPHGLKDLATKPFIRAEDAMTPEEQQAYPIATGVAEFGSSLTTPENVGLMSATGILGDLAKAPGASKMIKLLPRLTSLGFSASMLKGLYDQVPAFRQAWDSGDTSSLERMITTGALTSIAAGLGIRHGLKGGPAPPQEEVKVEDEPTTPPPSSAPRTPLALPPAPGEIGGVPIQTEIPSRYESEPNALPIQLPTNEIRLPGVTRALPPFRGTDEESFVAGEPTPVPRFSRYPLQQGIFGPPERTPEGRVPDAPSAPPTDLTTLDRDALPSTLVSPQSLHFDSEVHPQRVEDRVDDRREQIQSGKTPRVTGIQLPNGEISVAKGHQSGWAAQEEGVPVKATILPMSLAEKDAAEMKSHEFPENDAPVPAKMFADTQEDREKVDAGSEKNYLEASKEKIDGGAKSTATGEVSPEAREISALHEQNGGSTFNLQHGNLMGRDLYAVGAHPEAELTLDHAPSPEEVQNFIDKNRRLLSLPGRSIGTWNAGDGRHVLDIVATLPEKEARDLGSQTNQEAMFHLGGRGEIPLKAAQEAGNEWQDFRPNASGESSASLEAQNRVASEKQRGIQRFVTDTRSGKERPLTGVDAVDYKVKPHEISFKRDADGRVEIIDRGEKAGALQSSLFPNKIDDFFDRSEKKARARIKSVAKGETLGAGAAVPAALLRDYSIVGAAKIWRGARTFQAWSASMLADYGDRIRPHLRDLYQKAKDIMWKQIDDGGYQKFLQPDDVREFLEKGKDARNWYADKKYEKLTNEFFGKDAPVFRGFAAATSQGSGLETNVTLALKAYGQWKSGEPFEKLYLGKGNVERVARGEALEGPKIGTFGAAGGKGFRGKGPIPEMVIDQRMTKAFFPGKYIPTDLQRKWISTAVASIGKEMHMTPKEAQSAFWKTVGDVLQQGRVTSETMGDVLERKLSAKTNENLMGQILGERNIPAPSQGFKEGPGTAQRGPFGGFKPKAEETETKPGSLFDKAAQHYGITEDLGKAGYIGPDGRMLDFSDGGNSRRLDHGDISSVEGVQSARNSNPRIDFTAKTGAIRILHDADSLSIAFDAEHPPTDEQLSKLAPLLENGRKVFVDVTSQESQSGNVGGADALDVKTPEDLERVVRDAQRDVMQKSERSAALSVELHANPIDAVFKLWHDVVAKPTIDKVNDLVNVGLGKMEAYAPSIKFKQLLRSGAKFLPESYRKLKQYAVTAPIGEARTAAQTLGERLSKDLSQNTQQILMDVVRGNVSPNQLRILRSTPRLQDALNAAKEARQRLDSAGLKAVMQGLLKDTTYFKNIGKYVPRLYRRYEVDYDALLKATGERQPTRLDLDRFKHRENIDPAIRWQLGEINEAAYPVARGILDIESDAAYADFFNQVAKNPEWASDVPKNDAQGRAWTQLPDTPKLGSIRGKYLHPDIYNDINEMVKIRSEMSRFVGAMMGRYKRVRIVWAPASFVWHNLSRSFLNWYELGLHNPVTYGKALLDLKNKGPMYQEALKQGALRDWQGMDPDIFETMLDSWNKSQGGPFRRLGEMAAHTMATFHGKEEGSVFKAMREFRPVQALTGGKSDRVVQFYNALDQWMKLSGYMHLRETQPNMDPFKAADLSRRATIDYMDVPKLVDTARRFFLPFVTFPSRAIPQAISASFKAPWRALLLYGLVAGIQHASRQSLGITAQEDERNRKLSEPEAVAGAGLDQKVFGLNRYILLPQKDASGRYQYLDLNHLVHWTGVGAPPAPGVLPFGSSDFGGALTLPAQIAEREIYGNPVMSTFGDVLANRDPYTGKELYGPGQENSTMGGALANRVWKTVSPSLMPGNYGFDKIAGDLKGRPDYFGRSSSLPADLLGTFAGLNIRPEDPSFEAMFRNKEFTNALQEIRKSMYSTADNQRLTNEEKQARIKELGDEETQLVQKFQRLYQ